MKQYYSCAELADMKLAGIPASRPGIKIRAESEGWIKREVNAKGGKGGVKTEYQPPKAIMNLIKSTKLNIEIQAVKQPLTDKPQSTELTVATKQNASDLKDWQRQTAEARAAICQEIKRLAAAGGTDRAIMKLVDMAATSTLPDHLQQLAPLANARSGKAGKRTLSRRSMYRWLTDAEGGVATLAPKSCEKIQVPAWAPYLMSLYGQPQKPSLAYCIEQLPKHLPATIEVPSYSAANRFIKKISNVEAQKGRMGSREIKNIKAFVRRDTSQMWPSEAYTADGHAFDAEVAHPAHGKPFRPEITSVLDIATRKCVGWSAGLAESTWGVVDALRHACLNGGIPAIFYVDNGSGFKNAAMSNEATGFMARLSITLTHSRPYNSQARGIEERSHQSIWVRGAKELPTYMGADMDAQAKKTSFKVTRADIKAVGASKKLMPWLTFINWCQEQIDNYNNRPHRSLPKIYDEVTGKKRNQSPNEAWAAAVGEGFKPVLVEPHEADDLFRPYKEAVTRRGEITLFTNTYFSHDLEAYHGETMRVGYDIHDASRVWVRNQAGQLVTVAMFEANKRSYFPQSFRDQADEKRAKGRIQRAQAKIDEAEQELNPPQQLVYEAPIELPVMAMNNHHEDRLPSTPDVKIVENGLLNNVIAMPVKRPLFETDAAKYRWLLSNDEEVTVQDEAWLNYYRLTAEYEDLFGDREAAIR
ncbi:MAG: Mu transposase C-terminal domain-containing protein [Methylotenera sp.]|nr:Mu transposase C-terminal domain-containing protein [Methylotenera sp.]